MERYAAKYWTPKLTVYASETVDHGRQDIENWSAF